MADHGIVIGIDGYPGLSDLKGPCNDAQSFKSWLLDPTKGGLNDENVNTILSRDLHMASSDIADARPLQSELENLFMPYIEAAANKQHIDGRFFIFVAGHGFADPDDMESAALYAANAQKLFAANLAISVYVHFFRRQWLFDEIILIMDACRSTSIFHQMGAPPLPRLTAHPNAHKVKTFLGYGAAFNKVTREKEFEDETRGVFTTAVLDALENAPANRMGRVTGSVVKNHIHNIINGIAGRDTAAELDIHVDNAKEVLFLSRASVGGQDDVPFIETEFNVQDGHVGNTLVLEKHDGELVVRHQIDSKSFSLNLQSGFFRARIVELNFQQLVEVPGNGSVNL